MEIPKLFALFASNDISIWSKLNSRRVVHIKYGSGKIQKVYKQDGEIMIICIFNGKFENEGLANFRPQAFQEGFFTELELRHNFGNYLIKNEDILVSKKKEEDDNLKRIKDEKKIKRYETAEKNMQILRDSYVNNCYCCKRTITNMMERCNRCGWYICDYCRSCRCNYGN